MAIPVPRQPDINDFWGPGGEGFQEVRRIAPVDTCRDLGVYFLIYLVLDGVEGGGKRKLQVNMMAWCAG